MRHLLVAILCLGLIGSICGKQEPLGSRPDAIVKKLYKEHDAQKGPFFHREDRTILERYFTADLAELIRKDAVAAKGEVGAIEFDPLYESQDPRITSFKIGETARDGRVRQQSDNGEDRLASVEVTFHDSGKPRRLVFRLRQTAQQPWRIADIIYSDQRSLARILCAGS